MEEDKNEIKNNNAGICMGEMKNEGPTAVSAAAGMSLISMNFNTAKDLAFSFQNLNVSNSSKTLLRNISGYVKNNSITAVVGPSGSGKSLLLAGHRKSLNIDGKVFMSGREVDPKSSSNPTAYVPQDNYLIGELTPREMTSDTARLRRDENEKALDRDIWMLLAKLGLDSVYDSPIGDDYIVSCN